MDDKLKKTADPKDEVIKELADDEMDKVSGGLMAYPTSVLKRKEHPTVTTPGVHKAKTPGGVL